MMISNNINNNITITQQSNNNNNSGGGIVNDTISGDIINSNNNHTVTVSSLPQQPSPPPQVLSETTVTTTATSLSSNIQHLLSSKQQQNTNPAPTLNHLTSPNNNITLKTSASPSSCRLSRKKAKKQKITSRTNLNLLNNNNINSSNKSKRNSFLSLSSSNNNNICKKNLNSNFIKNEQNQNENQNNNNEITQTNNSINDHLNLHLNNKHLSEMIATDHCHSDPTTTSQSVSYPNMDLSSETQGITKRTVIIHKDSRGYGMRISGDNPVFIQHVNEEGAAYKAGVRSGDQIIKVNGTLVTRLGHAEVVRMIQSCGSFVGLTLLSTSTSAAATTINTSSIDQQRHQTPSSPTNSPTPPANVNQSSSITSTTTTIPPLSMSSSNINFSPIYPVSSVMLTGNNPIRITGPQPVPESTQQQYHENQIRTLQEMVNNEWRHLEELKLMRAPQSELDRCQKRINDMKSKLEIHQSNISSPMSMANTINSHSRQQSLENSTDHSYHQRTNSDQQQASSSNITFPRIMPMDEDVDLDPESSSAYQYEYIDDLDLSSYDRDPQGLTLSTSKHGIVKSASSTSALLRPNTTNNGANNRDKTKRDSKIFSSIFEASPGPTASVLTTKAWFNLHLDSLRLCRYLIQHKMVAPNELLFYVMTRTVFPKIVTTNTVPYANKAQVIQRWAYQIIATFVTKESPLFMQEFPQDYLEQFDRNLTALISANPSSTDVVASPFEPFLISIYETVRKQWEEFMIVTNSNQNQQQQQQQQQRRNSSWLQSTSNNNNNPKHDLESTIEVLFKTQSHIYSPQPPGSSATANTANLVATNNIQAKIDLRDIDLILDSFIQLVKLNQSETTMALISSLLAIGRYIFNITTSKHCLLLESSTGSASVGGSGSGSSLPLTAIPLNTIPSSSLNPLLKLSSESSRSSKSSHKRNSMIPIGSKSFSSSSHALGNSFDSSSSSLLASLSNGGKSKDSQPQCSSSSSGGLIIEDRSHCFVPIVEMNHIIYCTSCMLPMWGDPYTLKCTKCLMHTHLWCRKTAAANNICYNDTHQQAHQNLQSSGKQSSNSNNRRAKSEKKSVFEKITGKKGITSSKRNDFNLGALTRTSSCSSSSSSDSISSLISSSDLEDFATTTANKHDDDQILKNISESSNNQNNTPIPTTITPTNGTNNPTVSVNRSGSFVQRKKKKSSTSVGSPRKRSDPALTSKQISTMTTGQNVISGSTMTGTGALSQLTSARSSGALMNSASVGAHDSVQFRPITGQRAKNMTASDSSLMSATSVSAKGMKSPNSIPSGSGTATTIFSNNDSLKSSSTNLTSNSSPRRTRHRNTNDSAIQMDGSSEDDLQDCLEQPVGDQQQSNETLDEMDIPPPRPDSQTEKRRQIQMEIVQTEEEHHEVLRYIRRVYQKPLKKEKLFTSEQIDIIFGNIKELRSIHRKIFIKLNLANKLHLQSMSSDVYYIEEAIHDIFCGELGAQLENEASKFCVNRKIRNGIELWNQRKKDARLRGWVDSESRSRSMPENPLARLGLDDLLSRVFQRPLRYPLLFERLLKSTPKDSPGYRHLEQVMISIRRSNERINEATKKAELKARLAELIRKTDFSYFSNSSLIENLEQHELLHEGPLVWRITKQKLVDVLLILTDQIMLVLTRESNDRYVLKSHSNPTTKHGHRPDIKMDDLLMRDVATDQSAFFLVSKNQDIIYEFAAQTSNERKKWKDVITKAINEYRANHPSLLATTPYQLQTQKSFTSTRSMTMMDLKTSNINDNGTQQPPPLPPPIQNRPLPKLPFDHSSPPPPPPLPPPSATLFANRPLPQPPIDSQQLTPPAPHISHQPKYDGSVQLVTARDCHPSIVDLIPFSQVKISPDPSYSAITHRSKSDDLKEINDNIQNLIQERHRSGTINYDDLVREIQEMTMVYDVAKHDSDSKETLARLITDMFRKATEWSYHFVQKNEAAKQELSQRVRNSIESFVKSHIDSNFILPLPNDDVDGDQVDAVECPDPLFDNTTCNNTGLESLITPLTKVHLASVTKQVQVKRSLSDKSTKSDKSKEPGLDSFDHGNQTTNLNNHQTTNDNHNYDIVPEDCSVSVQDYCPKHDQINTSSSPNHFDESSPPLTQQAAISQLQTPSSLNPFIPPNDHTKENIVATNLEMSSIGVTEEFIVVLSDEIEDNGGCGCASKSDGTDNGNHQQFTNESDKSNNTDNYDTITMVNNQDQAETFHSSVMSNLMVKTKNDPENLATTNTNNTTTSQTYMI